MPVTPSAGEGAPRGALPVEAGAGMTWAARAALACALVLVAMSLRGGFWLDEILATISAWTPADFGSWLEDVHRENAHYLSILWMRLVGPTAGETVLRLPSAAAAIATLVVAWRMAREQGARGRLVAMVLWGGSWLFVTYAGEARGYSGAVFHSLVALAVDRRIAAGRASTGTCALGALNATVGILWQPVFLAGVAASTVWVAGLVVRRTLHWRQAAVLVAPPWLVFGAMLLTLGDPARAYGPQAEVLRTFAAFLGIAVAGPDVPALVGAVLVALLTAWSFRWAPAEVRAVALRNLLWIVAVPTLLLLRGAEVSYERYYLVALPPLLWTAAAFATRLLDRNARAATVVLGLYLIAQATGLVPFLRHARGDYAAAIGAMSAESDAPTVVVASDHDFRNRIVLDHYWRTRRISPPLQYVDAGNVPRTMPQWVLVHDLGWRPEARPERIAVGGVPFALEGRYPKGSLSGWHWFVYRRQR